MEVKTSTKSPMVSGLLNASLEVLLVGAFIWANIKGNLYSIFDLLFGGEITSAVDDYFLSSDDFFFKRLSQILSKIC